MNKSLSYRFWSLFLLLGMLFLSSGIVNVKADEAWLDALDPSFDNDGKLLSDLGSQNIQATAVIVQADQKMVVAGRLFQDTLWDYAVLRYCENGLLDNGANCGGAGFGVGGIAITDFGLGENDFAMDALLQPDGKILLAGYSYGAGKGDFTAARYNTDGSLDTTFGGDGRVQIDFSSASDERGYAVGLQADGKIVIVGVSYLTTWGDFAVVRLCANGSLDNGSNCGTNAFSSDGWLTTDFSGSSDWAEGVGFYGDTIIVGGSGGDRDFAVARYTTSGTLDTTFSVDGKATAAVGTGWDYGQDVIVQPDGKVIVVGGSGTDTWNHNFSLVRFTSSGSLDTTFNDTGTVMTEFSGYSDRILSAILDGDKILAVGYATDCYGEDWGIARYTLTGALDTSFSGDGKTTLDFGEYYDSAHGVALMGDGRIAVAGVTGADPSGNDIALARFSSAGVLDSSLGGDGKLVTDSGGYTLGYAVAVPSGKILVAGWVNQNGSNDFALARLLENGVLDTGFAVGGVASLDFSQGDDHATAMAVQSDGKILLTGYTLRGEQIDFAVARLCPDGSVDNGSNCGSPGFGTGGKVVVDFGGSDYGVTLLIQPDGDIVVAGNTRVCPNSDYAAVHLNANGSLDTAFSGDGRQTVDFSAYWDTLGGAALQEDGKLVMIGTSGPDYTHQDFALARLCPNGSLDNGANCGSQGFGDSGAVSTDISASSDRGIGVAVQEDGKIIAAGDANETTRDFALARYCSDGKLDDGVNCGSPGFGSGGIVTTDFFENGDYLSSLLLLPRGKILVSGFCYRSTDDGSDEDFCLALYNSDGSLNSGFGVGGLQNLDFGSTSGERPYALTQQWDGKLLVTGLSNGYLAAARFLYGNIALFLPAILK